MKKGRRYIEPITGKGDKDVKKRDIKKLRREAGKAWDGVSRVATNLYRENFDKIFKGGEKNEE